MMKNNFWQHFRFFKKSFLAIIATSFYAKNVLANPENSSENQLLANQNNGNESIISYIQNHAPAIATIFFFLFFCYVVYSVFKKGKEKTFDEYAKIPFKENDNKNTSQQSNKTDDNNKN